MLTRHLRIASWIRKLPQTFPFVKWAGGKTQLLDRLEKLVPKSFGRYFEPFLGGGALFYHLVSNRQFIAYLSDINQELINVYEVVKSNVEELIDVLRVYKKEYHKAPEIFYRELRDNFDTENRSHIERAANIYYPKQNLLQWTLSSKFPW